MASNSKRFSFSLNINKENEKKLYEYLINFTCDPGAHTKEVLFKDMLINKGKLKEAPAAEKEKQKNKEEETIDKILDINSIEC